jgi:hydroxyacylglutathione hydrolase
MMLLQTFSVGLLQCNCSVLGCPETGEALVIDPGDEAERILQVLARHDLACKTILLTHAHLDHVGAAAPLAAATGAEILLHEADRSLYAKVPEQAALFGFRSPPLAPIDRYLGDGESLGIGRLAGEVRHTPGHSPGGICLLVPASTEGGTEPGRLFAGDTLFAGSIGRTDLWGGSHDDIVRSIKERLLTLPDETIVIPGHGGPTTIGEERRWNPFLAADKEE